jgi:ankyrin repeat protein
MPPKYGDIPILQKLIQSGASLNLQDKNKETALHFAARYCQAEAARLLIDHGAGVDIKDAHGNTALFRAVFDSGGRGDMITLLLRSGANKALKNDYDVSPEDLARSIANYDVASFFDS